MMDEFNDCCKPVSTRLRFKEFNLSKYTIITYDFSLVDTFLFITCTGSFDNSVIALFVILDIERNMLGVR